MTCKHLLRGAPDCVFCHRDQLQQELRLAEEGLANYQKEINEVRTRLCRTELAWEAQVKSLRDDLTASQLERYRLEKKCAALALLHYGSSEQSDNQT